jgi:hypothetical protein
MDIFGYPWIYPLSEQKAMDIHGYIHTGLCFQMEKRNSNKNIKLIDK